MSGPAAALATLLLLFSRPALAFISSPQCSSGPVWQWAYNSLNQNPCGIAAFLMSTCHNEGNGIPSYTLNPLSPTSLSSGYTPTSLNETNMCICNTVTYSLLSACASCQGGSYVTWSQYIVNCTKTSPPTTFPNPVPSGTRVPRWALLDVSTSAVGWDPVQALLTGDGPEIFPSQAVVAATSLPVSQSTYAPVTSGDTSSATSNNGNTPVIVGAAVGGLVFLAMVALGIYRFYLRPRRLRVRKNADLNASATARAPSPTPTRQARVASALFVGNSVPESDEEALKPPPPYEETVDTFVDSEAPASSSMSGPSSSTHIIRYDPPDEPYNPHGPAYKQREPEVSVKEPLLPQNHGAGPSFRKN